MSKKNILTIAVAAFLAGVLLLMEYVNKKPKSELVSESPVPMNMNEPKPEADTIKIKAAGAVTFLLSADNEVYYYKGKFTGAVTKTGYPEIGHLIKRYMTEIDNKELMFVIKAAKGSSFRSAIDILDEMVVNKVPPGHYAETDITNEETECIDNYKEK